MCYAAGKATGTNDCAFGASWNPDIVARGRVHIRTAGNGYGSESERRDSEELTNQGKGGWRALYEGTRAGVWVRIDFESSAVCDKLADRLRCE